MLKIWGRSTSSNVQKVLWCCTELGIEFDRTDWGGPFGGNRDPEYLKLNPNGLSQRDWKLRLNFNAPPTARGGAFVVIVYKQGGGLSTSLIRLNRRGGGSKVVPFSSRNINHVDVLFVNNSTRFTCWVSNSSPYSCLGDPKDDGLKSEFTGKAFRS